MKKIYTLLSFMALLGCIKVNGQVLYSNTTQTTSRFNPGLGQSGTPKIVFDDINIDAAVIGDADSVGFTNIKVGIRRIASAPAVTVNVYLTELDPLSFGLDSLPVIPPTLIGTFNLAANGAASQTQILSIGDSVNVFKALKRDTGNLFTGFQTAFVGVSFSTNNTSNGWRFTSDGNNFDAAWEYNADSVAPRSAFGFTGLTSTFYAQAFGRPVYSPLAFDVKTLSVNPPDNVSCISGPQTVTVDIQNLGQSPVAAGAASVTLKVGGANIYSGTLSNTASIPVNGTATISFTNVILTNPGLSLDTAIVSFGSDLRNTNDTAFNGSLTAETINSYPITDDIEGATLTIAPFVNTIAGNQLWTLHVADTAYTNPDMLDSLHANSGLSFLYFDSYASPNSTGFQSRLFTNCITLGAGEAGSCASSLSFFMSHDTAFSQFASDDSLYISISTDKGITWNRMGAGFGRLDPAFAVPGWRQEIVDLSAFNGQTFQIGFEGVSQWGNIIGIDDISIASNCIVPVTLTSFNVQKQSKANRLSWKTSQEINSLKYVIEQSKNGRDFTTLGEVAAAGNSSTERTYSFIHNLPSRGYNYYRLKMIDRDNKAKYSETRNVQNLGANEISSYPNPVKNSMTVAINADKADVANVVISDLSGKMIYTKTFTVTEGDNNFTVNTASLTAGNYVIKIQLSGDVSVKKFTKL